MTNDKEILEDDIEIRTDDLRLAMSDLLENGPNEEDYSRVIEQLEELTELAERLNSLK